MVGWIVQAKRWHCGGVRRALLLVAVMVEEMNSVDSRATALVVLRGSDYRFSGEVGDAHHPGDSIHERRLRYRPQSLWTGINVNDSNLLSATGLLHNVSAENPDEETETGR